MLRKTSAYFVFMFAALDTFSRSNGTPVIRSYPVHFHRSSEDSNESPVWKSSSEWESMRDEIYSYEDTSMPWESMESSASIDHTSPVGLEDAIHQTNKPPSPSPNLTPTILPTSNSPTTSPSPQTQNSGSTPTSGTVQTVSASSSMASLTTPMPTPMMTSHSPHHVGENLHWLLMQERRRHPWQAPVNAPREIQEALDAYHRTDYRKFCESAMLDDKEPLRVTDGSFHPKFEIVPGVGVYRFHATPATWEEAREICEDEGAQVAIVNSFPEAKALAEIHNRCPFILDTHFNDYQFVGAHDLFGEGHWETTTGDKLNETGYLRWGYGQPDNAHQYGEDCLTMNRYGFFNDVPCWVKLPFTCEHA